MGADSIALTQAVRRLRREFGTELRLTQLFRELPTIEALAAHLAATTPRREETKIASDEPGAPPDAPLRGARV